MQLITPKIRSTKQRFANGNFSLMRKTFVFSIWNILQILHCFVTRPIGMCTTKFKSVLAPFELCRTHTCCSYLSRKKTIYRVSIWFMNTSSTFLRWHYPDQVKGQKIGFLSQPANSQHP